MHILHFQAFDTECEIRIPKVGYGNEEGNPVTDASVAEILERIRDRCLHFEERLSPFIPGSDIARLNDAGVMRAEVDVGTAALICSALTYCECYSDLFDITIGSAARLWDFHRNKPLRAQADIALSTTSHINHRMVHVEDTTVTLDDPLIQLDLGAAAKGFIADEVATLLGSSGIERAIIDLGGNIYALGSRACGRGWQIAIEDPREPLRALVRFRVSDLSLVTSSTTQRAFEQDSQLFHHILDPRTGMPRQTDLVSATVVSSSSLQADCLATIAIAAGMERAQHIAEVEGVNVVLLGVDGKLFISPQLAELAVGYNEGS